MKTIGSFEGQVIKYNVERGFGFISINDKTIKDEAFIHFSDIEPDKDNFKKLMAGQKVSFELIRRQEGYAAKNLKVIGNVYDDVGDISGNM